MLEGGAEDDPLVLEPGFYFATEQNRDGEWVATGKALRMSGHVNITSGSMDFGEYVFFGGIDIKSPGTVTTWDAGRYVLAGALDGTRLLETANKTKMIDSQPPNQAPAENYPGEIFIFTDPKFLAPEQIPTEIINVEGLIDDLGFSDTYIVAGNDAESLIALHGLNRNSTLLPEDLKEFAPVVFWQDQRNSSVKYTDQGEIDLSCGDGASYETPCLNDTESDNKWEEDHKMHLQAGSQLQMWGAIYQPRGAWVHIQADDDYIGPIQLISGGLSIQGNPALTLRGLDSPITNRTIALVE